jgi:hypothetical protein
VELDPLFLDCATVTTDLPLDVFVQLLDDCNGVYVKSDARGFDVYELKDGRSGAGFSYRALACRKGVKHERLPHAPEAPALANDGVGR